MLKRNPLPLLGLLFVAAVAHGLYYYGQLPDEVAVHFDINVEPDNWASKGVAVGLYIAIMALMMALFAGLGPLIRRTPESAINLPDKDYWLAPERREETIRTMSAMMGWVGVSTGVMMIGAFHLMFEANLRTPVGMSAGPLVGLLLGDIVATFAIVFLMVRHFKRPASS